MLSNYLKIAWRNLRTHRTYTLLNIIGLSVGMAGGLLIFLFLRHHLSTDRHHANFDTIVRISTDLHLDDGSIEYNAEAPPPMAATLRARFPQVAQAAFMLGWGDITISTHRTAQAVPVRFLEHGGIGFVEPEWFDVLTHHWLRGSASTALNAPNRAVLTESWARRYFGTINVLGQLLTLDNKTTVTIAGIVADPPGPTDIRLGLMVSLSTLRQLIAVDLTDWSMLNSQNRLYARLKSPEAVPSLQRAMPALSKQQYGKSARIYRFVVQPLADLHFDVARDPAHASRPALLWSLGIIGVVLVVAACINFINLATAQAIRRSKEVGIRKTLGSNRKQLIGQFLLETSLITVVAISLALLLVTALLPVFNDWVRVTLSLQPNWLMVGFIGLLLIGTIVLAGGYPAAVLSGYSPLLALRGTIARSPASRSFTVRKVLIVVQFVVCQVLVIGALVVANQGQYMRQADLGFNQANVVMVTLPYGQKAKHDAFKQQLLTYAGIQSVSLSVLPPSSARGYGGSFKFDDRADWEKFPVMDRLADADYLKTYSLKLLAGRNLTPGDTIRDYVINEKMLHKLGFSDPQQVLGKKLQYYLSPIPLPIVGVVTDFHQKSLRDEIGPCIMASYAAWYRQAGIRISGNNSAQTIQQIRQVEQQIFPHEAFEYQFLDEQLTRLYETETLTARLINAFTGIAILICYLGLYGLVTFTVSQRTKEIGVRKVLGASVSSIVALLSKDFLKLVLIAIVIASPLAWYAMTQWLQDFAYKIDIEWWVFALAGLLAVGIALLTVSFQSVKAALMNPVKSLRSE